jgi:hypothetical protein
MRCNERRIMYKLTKLMEMVLCILLACPFTPMLYPLALPHLTSHWGKTHFPINICGTIHYAFLSTPLVYSGVKLKVPSSLSDREFGKKLHINYLYPEQSEVPPRQWQSMFDGIFSFAQVASMKRSKSGSNAVWLRIRGFTPRGVKLLCILMVRKELC